MESDKSSTETVNNQSPFAQTYFHGTKADLKIGDLIQVGDNSNFWYCHPTEQVKSMKDACKNLKRMI